ncbi:MAG: hypothetical protein HYY93_12160 [Planctomycetes bacterium]|nr:hypothetical protein [Planctomycetota bacterium]
MNRTEVCLLAAVLAAVLVGCRSTPPTAPASPEHRAAGAKLWEANCAACHFVPDPAIRFDRIWLEMLQTTS